MPDELLVAKLAAKMLELKMSLVTAESCTGGGVGYWLTSISGSSNWFRGGYIVYSNEAKIRDLGVSPAALSGYGAVSEEVAEQMAIGALQKTGSNLAVSVTGIAGPDGGSPLKPVGTVCFGWANGDTSKTETQVFSGDRQQIRIQSMDHAIRGLLLFLEKSSSGG